MKEFAERRHKLGLSQRELGAQLGIPVRTIEDWERGVRTPVEWAKRLLLKELDEMIKNATYQEAVEKYLAKHTKDFSVIGAGGEAAFFLNGEKYIAPENAVHVGYRHGDGTVTVAWGDPDNKFVMHGAEVVLLPDSTSGKDLLCFLKKDDAGDGYHIYAVQSIDKYGEKYVHI